MFKLEFGEFKGHRIIKVGEEGTKYPFSFGKVKAAKLLSYIEQDGADKFVSALKELTGN